MKTTYSATTPDSIDKMSNELKKTPILTVITSLLQDYCRDIEQIDNELWFTFNSVRMHLRADAFTMNAIVVADVFVLDDHDNEDFSGGLYTGCELLNAMNRNMHPYTFIWDDLNHSLQARKFFALSISEGLELLLKIEIYRMYYLGQQVEKIFYMNHVSDFPDDEYWMQFLLSVIDKWVGADLLDLNILYLHGFASSGNSGTAREIQLSLPHCKVISPDLPVNPADTIDLIREVEENNQIDLVIGTSMGGLLALFTHARNKIIVNPSFHASQIMERRLGGADSVIVPFFKKRDNGETEFELTRNIANSYSSLEATVSMQTQLGSANILGIFGTDDDVVDCKDEFLSHSLNIRYFKGEHRLTKEAIEEVVIPSILQMVSNEKLR